MYSLESSWRPIEGLGLFRDSRAGPRSPAIIQSRTLSEARDFGTSLGLRLKQPVVAGSSYRRHGSLPAYIELIEHENSPNNKRWVSKDG